MRKVKIPVWIIITLIMMATVALSAAITDYVAENAIRRTLYEVTTDGGSSTGQYPDWFIEWQNTVYLPDKE